MIKYVIRVFCFFLGLVTVPVSLSGQDRLVKEIDADRLERRFLGYALPHDSNNWAWCSVCKLENGSYFMTAYRRGDPEGMYGCVSDDKTDFSHISTDDYAIRWSDFDEIEWTTGWGAVLQVFGEYLYCVSCSSTRTYPGVCIFRCKQSADVTDRKNWQYVCEVCDETDMPGGDRPIDAKFYLSETPIHGHKYWVSCLDGRGDESGGSGEGDDEEIFVFYSDDFSDDWTKGNNGDPVIDYPDGSNWPVAYEYIENAGEFILFDTRHDAGATRHSRILYGTIGNMNSTCNTTSGVVVPRNVDGTDPRDDYGVLEPDLLLEDDTLYCYYTCAPSQNSRGGIGVVSFEVSSFISSR